VRKGIEYLAGNYGECLSKSSQGLEAFGGQKKKLWKELQVEQGKVKLLIL
jgi:hypothetical protein